MGLIELHFHESKFDFSPSVTTGADEEAAPETADSEGDDEDVESVGWKDEDEAAESSSSAGVGALVALVVFAALVGLKRRGGDDEDVELEA